MKSIIKFLKESNSSNSNHMILEKLQDPKLIQVAKYLRQFKSHFRNFSSIFRRYDIEWDKITPSDWTEIDDINLAKKEIRKMIRKSDDKLITIALITDYKDGEIRYLISNDVFYDFKELQWQFVSVTSGRELKPTPQEYKIGGPRNWNGISQKEVLSYIQDGCIMYLLNAYKFAASQNYVRYDLKVNRRKSKEGMTHPGNEFYYKQVAEENRKRYKEIIAKNRAKRLVENDELSEQVQDILNKSMIYSKKLLSDPVKYADCTWTMDLFCESVSKLISYYGNYVRYLGDSVSNKQLSTWRRDPAIFQDYEKKLKNILSEINGNYIPKLEDKMR